LAAILPFVEQSPLARRLDSSTIQPSELETPPIYLCPGDDLPGLRQSNYAGNFGALIQRDGANGLFPIARSGRTGNARLHFEAEVRARDITDGTANTAMASEALAIGTNSHIPSDRVDWDTPVSLRLPDQADAFVDLCATMPLGNIGWQASAGDQWHANDRFATLYTHHLPPNSPRCTNAGDMTVGSYSPSSNHPGGVNVLIGDGRVRFVSEATDRLVWQAAGSRDGSEAVRHF